MRSFKDGLISFILSILIIGVFVVTLYFCLDVFGIITIPDKYSLVNLLYAKMDELSVEEYIENIVPVDVVKKIPTVHTQENMQNEESTVEPPNIPSAYEQNTAILDHKMNVYYEQLDTYGKTIYQALVAHKEDLKSGTYTINFGTTFNDLLHAENGADVLNQAFQLSVNAFTFDYPEVFYLDITKMYLLTETISRPFSTTFKVSIGANEGNYLNSTFYTEAIVNDAISQVEQVKDYILQNATGSVYDKVRYVHNYLIDTVEYDNTFSQANIYNMYGALVSQKSVCEGYAKSFKYLLDAMGIPCIIACGTGRNSSGEIESHAWNYVQVNDVWYAVDVTWDDPVIIGFGKITDDIRYHYFLKGANTFFEDHLEDGSIIDTARFTYPELSVVNYE